MSRFGRNVRPGRSHRLDRGTRHGVGPGTSPEELANLIFLYPSPSRGRLFQDSAMATRASIGDPVGAREDYSRSGAHATQATTARKPTYSATGPSVSYDGVDDLLKATYALSVASRFAIAMAAWRADGSDEFELSVPTVANLTDEYYCEVENGDILQDTTMEANFDPDDWLFVGWERVGWDYDDGMEHDLINVRYDGNNRACNIYKSSQNKLTALVMVGGVQYKAELTPSWSAGDEVFIGARLSGGTLTLYHDTNGDDTLETDSEDNGGAGIPAAGAGAWKTDFGEYDNGAPSWDGGINLVLTAAGSSATPITNRFNSGDGEDIKTWMEANGEDVVYYLPKSKDGVEVTLLSYGGATQLLATGNVYQLDLPGGAGDRATVPDHDALDVTTDIEHVVLAFMDDWTPVGAESFITKDDLGVNRDYGFYMGGASTGLLRFLHSPDGTTTAEAAANAATGFTNGSWYWLKVTHATATGKTNFYGSDDPITTAPADVSWTQ
ncbi:MAG: hypothetical protein KAJ42_00530, partial [Gemmatimonadetes bacterium]|nr:hypothetical protein [Gemmatimonadota bacterium]